MIEAWLLFGVLALVSGQIIYPDQYKMMTVDLGRASASLPADYPTLASNNQPVQIDQQFNGEPASQFNTTKPVEEQFYPTTTRVPLYSSTSPTASPQPMSETWGNHVNHYYIIYTHNHDYLLYILKSFIYFLKFLFKVF